MPSAQRRNPPRGSSGPLEAIRLANPGQKRILKIRSFMQMILLIHYGSPLMTTCPNTVIIPREDEGGLGGF